MDLIGRNDAQRDPSGEPGDVWQLRAGLMRSVTGMRWLPGTLRRLRCGDAARVARLAMPAPKPRGDLAVSPLLGRLA